MNMFMLEDIVLWQVAVAAGINFLVGFAWYSPALFGEKWMKLLKIKPDKNMNVPLHMVVWYLIGLAHAYGLALVLEHFNAFDFVPAIQAAVVMCALFQVAGMCGSVLSEQKPAKLVCINAGYALTSFILMAVFYAYVV